MLFYARVDWTDDECKKGTDEIFLTAKDYADAAEKVENELCVVSMSLYAIDGDMLYVRDYSSILDEARKATF